MAKKAKVKNLASDEGLAKSFTSEAETAFEKYRSDREDIDDLNEIADYMYSCAQNRSIMSSEKSKGMDRDGDTRANVGSTVYFRQVNTLASQLVQVAKSRPDMWKYVTVGNAENGMSHEDAKQAADNANALARWTWKQDRMGEKLPEFAVHAFKYSNVYAMIRQNRTYARRKVIEPIFDTVIGTDGQPRQTQTGENVRWVTEPKENFPSISFPHVDMVYADRYIGNIADQNCVIMLSRRTRSEIYQDVMLGYFDQDAYDKITKDDEWDGTTGGEQAEKEFTNRERDYSPGSTGTFLQWDVFMRAPIDDAGSWDEDNPPQLYWGTIIGNTMSNGKVMRIERNPDPDDEIPIKEIRVNPDSSDELFHTTNAEVVRSAYSASCTLMNMALDNMGNVNDPPLKIVDGQHRVKDFTYKKGARWHVDNVNAITQMEIRDNTLQTGALLDRVDAAVNQALATDPALMGQYAGARTSASEFLGVNSNTKLPHLTQISYILNQLLPWMARKYMSYWYAYGLPEQIAQIADQDKYYDIYVKDVAAKMQFGFDVVVDIVDEYEDDMVKQQQTTAIIQTIGSVPFYQQSPFHTVNAGELLKEWLTQMKWNPNRIIMPSAETDSVKAARSENQAMLVTGQYDRPQPGENHIVHLREHESERLRWNGLEKSSDLRAVNLPLLDQHIAEHKQYAQSAGAAPPPAAPGNETPGEVVGNQQAAALGAMQ
jgi:hypothetical protein